MPGARASGAPRCVTRTSICHEFLRSPPSTCRCASATRERCDLALAAWRPAPVGVRQAVSARRARLARRTTRERPASCRDADGAACARSCRSIACSSVSTARAPSSAIATCTDVSGGLMYRAIGMSSNPATAMSSGTRRPGVAQCTDRADGHGSRSRRTPPSDVGASASSVRDRAMARRLGEVSRNLPLVRHRDSPRRASPRGSRSRRSAASYVARGAGDDRDRRDDPSRADAAPCRYAPRRFSIVSAS